MSYKNRIDLHMHTLGSFDGNYPAADMCRAAVENGLSVIAITDHFDVDFFERHNLDVRQKTSYEDICGAKTEFESKIKLLRGIEIGQPAYEPELTVKSLARYEYDFVIGSIHNLRGMPDFSDLDYPNYTDEKIYSLLDEYFNEELILAKWNGFDTLAHLTYPLRYLAQHGRTDIDLSRFDDITDEIFKVLIANGKALEINTSGLRQPIGKTMPTENYIRRFRELGGELLTLGSDAHFTEHVGAGIDTGYDIALNCGFEYVTYFENRKPVQVKIEK
ncbi:MAG: histidinol-phosphatase HisJ family protein [Acutalibacteraceae bacterium]|nr:histidinol-phosphatase HisJ family protein [Acutalibacteraceae bacterium]